VGFEELFHLQEVIEVKGYYRIQPNGNFAELFPAETGIFEFEGEFNRIGRVKVSFEEDKGIKETLVAARTFCYKDDIKKLQKANYGKGGYTINTLVIDWNDEEYDFLVYSSEPAYHKLLDLIGDLALLGGRIKGKIYSFKGSHRLNHMVREFLWKTSRDEKN
jgi:UDP-3-O-[3-hydroxymyristoyl] N-acetylglucosamine deacetylase